MKNVLIIGSGLSGLSCAIELAEKGICSTLVSPYPSERAQTVMAAGGINASLGNEDSPEQHAADTLKSGGNRLSSFRRIRRNQGRGNSACRQFNGASQAGKPASNNQNVLHCAAPINKKRLNPTAPPTRVTPQITFTTTSTTLTIFALPIPNVIKDLLVDTATCANTKPKKIG